MRARSLRLPPPVLDRVDKRTMVVRDDLLPGGSKIRFLPHLTKGAGEVVFGGPFCGGAPLALSVLGRRTGQKITLFYAARANLHPRQAAARENGAELVFVRPGYMTCVQARARTYAAEVGALFLPLGFDVPAAQEPYVEVMREVRSRVGSPDEVWCATGSGMLARCLGLAFPDSMVRAVAVGLASRHDKQSFGSNVELLGCDYRFEQEARGEAPPFPACPNYERKAWELLCASKPRGTVLFWNILGPS